MTKEKPKKELTGIAFRFATNGSDDDLKDALAKWDEKEGGANRRAKTLVRRALSMPEPSPIVVADAETVRAIIREEIRAALARVSISASAGGNAPVKTAFDTTTAEEV